MIAGRTGFLVLGAIWSVTLTTAPAAAQTGEVLGSGESGQASAPREAEGTPQTGTDHDLARQLSNPVSSLISVPFQENIDFGIGPNDGFKSTLNIQPVVPIVIDEDWNLILRTILPIIYQDDVTAPGADQFGLGDTLQSFFFSPRHPGPSGIVWGAGPAILYPTATDNLLGSQKLGLGPTIVVLKQSGPNTFGLLANHVWSIAGSSARSEVSSTFLQPFFSHTTPSATTYGLNLESSYDWVGDHWLVPVNLTVTQLTRIGSQRVSVGGGLRYYVERPDGGPEWGIRMIFTLLYPRG